VKIKFKDSQGKQAFAIKPASGGAKLVGPKDQELARYTLKDGKLKIKGPKDQILGYVKFDKDRIRVFDSSQTNEKFRLQRQSDGDWKWEKAQEIVGKIKKRSYGWEVKSTSEKTEAKIKLKNGKVSIRDSKEKTILSTKGKISSLACTGIAFSMKEDLKVRVALALALMKIERGMK